MVTLPRPQNHELCGREHQKWKHFHSHRIPISPHPSGGGFKISKWISLTYGLGNFQTAAFVLGLRVSLHVSLSDWNLSSLEFLGLLDISPIDFQSQMFGGLFLHCRSQGLKCLMLGGHKPLGKSNSFKHERQKKVMWSYHYKKVKHKAKSATK